MAKENNNYNEYSEENPYILPLTDEDGNTVDFEHLDTVRVDNDDYIVCIPYDDEQEVVTEIALFKLDKDENSEDCLSPVLDDDLADRIYEEFKRRNADNFEFEN